MAWKSCIDVITVTNFLSEKVLVSYLTTDTWKVLGIYHTCSEACKLFAGECVEYFKISKMFVTFKMLWI